MMQLVVDTNILFTFFWKKSVSKAILLKMNLELFSPEFALEEINSHKSDILKKTGISNEEFKEMRQQIAIAVSFIPLEKYKEFLKPASGMCPDLNDVDFFALALKLNLPLWSNDTLLKRQNKINTISTSDLLEKPEFADILFPD